MGKTAFLFAGQGAQYVGMGKELYDNFKCARDVYDRANEVLGMDIRKLCFEGPADELGKTVNTQPSIVVTSMAIAAVLDEYDIKAQYAAGLSLGEYSALIYAGVLSFEDGIRLIQKRGMIMQNAVPEGTGAMAAIIGLDKTTVLACCRALGEEGIVEAANFNCPGQIVISGERKAVEKAAENLKAAGAMKTVMLNVSGPFHSSLLRNAGLELEKEIRRTTILNPGCKVVSNFDNTYYDGDVENTVAKLKNQISSSVMWEDNVRKILQDEVDTLVEIGPGKALSGFVRKIDRSKAIYNVEDIKSLEKLNSSL